MKNQKGFSLIELLIVVVIIGIIAAIAIPNLLASRRSANEGSAVSSLRTIHGAQMTYASTTGAGSYATLAQLGTANLTDTVLGCSSGTGTATAWCTKSGYKFASVNTAASSGTAATFGVHATPVTNSGVSATGTRDFAIFTEGVLYTGTAGGLTTVTSTGISGTSSALAN